MIGLEKVVLQDSGVKEVAEVSRKQVALIYFLHAYGDDAYEVVDDVPNTSYSTQWDIFVSLHSRFPLLAGGLEARPSFNAVESAS